MHIKITFKNLLSVGLPSLVLNVFWVFTVRAGLRFNVELAQCPGQHWVLCPSMSLRNLTLLENQLKLWLSEPRSVERGQSPGTFDQGEMSSWII